MLKLPPLSLYVHMPWCIQKCPYCDFNSYRASSELPEAEYLAALLADLEQDLPYVQGRKLHSIFIGGGTPSLFSGAAIQALLMGIFERIEPEAGIEITLEANPGAIDNEKFALYRQAGVTRLSIGVQSFNGERLHNLGRIHNPEEACSAAVLARQLNFPSFNLDLMHGLPQQSVKEAMYDLDCALELSPPHLSWYQLTLEEESAFGKKPPQLPDEDTLGEIYLQGKARLEAAGYRHYEVSAYARPGFECRHNLNYWRFGDYLGIGAGAHGKITLPDSGTVVRSNREANPRHYLTRESAQAHWQRVLEADLPFEYFMNRLRLFEPVPKAEFSDYTGLPLEEAERLLAPSVAKGLIIEEREQWSLTPLGQDYLNVVLESLLADE